MVRQFVLRAAAVRRGGRRWRESGPRVPRDGHACRRGHEVRRHIIHGARSARRRRHRLLLPGYRGERRWCLAAARARPLICSEDILRQAEDLSKVRRDAIQRDVLLARPTLAGGATIVAYVVEQSRAPVTDVDARRASPAADEKTDYQVRVCVENVEICQTDGCQIVFTADG